MVLFLPYMTYYKGVSIWTPLCSLCFFFLGVMETIIVSEGFGYALVVSLGGVMGHCGT